MQVKPSTYLKGLATYIPGARKYFCSSSGGTVSARYCYAVWMRHQVMAYKAGLKHIDSIAELGPGDSLGIGLCAILSGCKTYYGLDAKAHANTERNRTILDELVTLFRRREPIPDIKEFPNVSPVLEDYSFPSYILTDELLNKSLQSERILAIHKALINPRHVNAIHISYIAPWEQASLDESAGKLDMVFSQAVMEHVEKVYETYRSLNRYLRPGGLMSHAIDYKSHGYTCDWNGHWTLSEFTWRILKGNRPYLINRLAHSDHIEALGKAGFQIISEIKKRDQILPRESLASNFLSFTEDDLRTSGAFIQAVKPLAGVGNSF